MRIGIVTALVLLAGCTFSGNECKSDAGPSAQCSLVGTWTGGKNTVTFATDGTYTATFDGANDTGTWSVSGLLGCGAVVTFGEAACGTIKGTYGLSIDSTCTTFSLSGQSDDCGTRANALSNTQYKLESGTLSLRADGEDQASFRQP